MAVQPDGKVVAAGAGTVGDGVDLAVARRNTDGTPDPSFSADGKVNSNSSPLWLKGGMWPCSPANRGWRRVHQQWQQHGIRRGALPRRRGAFHGRHAERIDGRRQYQGRDRALALTPDSISTTRLPGHGFPHHRLPHLTPMANDWTSTLRMIRSDSGLTAAGEPGPASPSRSRRKEPRLSP